MKHSLRNSFTVTITADLHVCPGAKGFSWHVELVSSSWITNPSLHCDNIECLDCNSISGNFLWRLFVVFLSKEALNQFYGSITETLRKLSTTGAADPLTVSLLSSLVVWTSIIGLVLDVTDDPMRRGGCSPPESSWAPHTLRETWLLGCCCLWFLPEPGCTLPRLRTLTPSCLTATRGELIWH